LEVNGDWSDGVLERWSIEKLPLIASNHHSKTPLLQYSGRFGFEMSVIGIYLEFVFCDLKFFF